jgi:hypothetical protein
MISAKEAREQLNIIETRKNENQIALCEKEINKSINDGLSCASLNTRVTVSVKIYLESLGYKVEYGSQYNEQFTSISW